MLTNKPISKNKTKQTKLINMSIFNHRIVKVPTWRSAGHHSSMQGYFHQVAQDRLIKRVAVVLKNIINILTGVTENLSEAFTLTGRRDRRFL